jgi:signal transduction histidine kinase
MMEMSLVLNSTLQLEPLLRRIMDAAAEITEAESASILLIDEKTRELYFMAFDSESDSAHTRHLKRIPVPLKGSVAGTVVLENRPIAINDVTQHPQHYRQADAASGFQTQSLLGVPMSVRNNVMGVLEAVNKLGGNSWTEDDIHFMQILSAQAGIAINNAQLVTQLTEAYQELSQLDKMKNDFIAIASHELRTPLSVILGYASFLKEEAQGDASDHAAAVLTSALKMRQIIEDMTNLRFVKLGESELLKETISVAEIMLRALSDVRSMSEVQGHQLNFSPPPTEWQAHLDSAKIVMALTNLLNNAIKYSPKNGPIEFTFHRQPDEIWLVVQDHGIGLEASHFERIFEEFFQVEDHMTRRHNGMGLGLAIAKAIVVAHHGRIWVESPGLGQGCTFYISLPLLPS